jgi:hypothetical protein
MVLLNRFYKKSMNPEGRMPRIRPAKCENQVSRREFVKGYAVGGTAGLAIGAGGTSLILTNSTKLWFPKSWDHETDVAVGTGFAGSYISEAAAFGRIACENAGAEKPWTSWEASNSELCVPNGFKENRVS